MMPLPSFQVNNENRIKHLKKEVEGLALKVDKERAKHVEAATKSGKKSTGGGGMSTSSMVTAAAS